MAVTKLEITSRRSAGGGREFGEVGVYEQLEGFAHFAVDPQHPGNECITDIKLAPRGPDGLVHFSATFSILRPTNPAAGRRRLLLGVPNRGNKLLLRTFNSAPMGPEPEEGPDLGDGFLMRHGYTLIECGWEWGVNAARGRLTVDVPDALGSEGPVSGKVMLEYQLDRPQSHISLLGLGGSTSCYSPFDLNDTEASLTVKEHQQGSRQMIDRHLWGFARVENGMVLPDPGSIYLSTGFQAGKIYEVVYRTLTAPVIGLGLLAMRDIASFLKYASEGQGNPCAGSIDYAYAYGPSQSGRFLRQLLYLGLNQDEDQRLVFDGVMPHIAGARRGQFNQRGGFPSGATFYGTENLFPFHDTEQTDQLTGQSDGLLSRLAQQGQVPKVFYTNSSCEYWRSGASLIHTDVNDAKDAQLPDSVRVYLMAGTQHSAGFLPLTKASRLGERARYHLNSVDYYPLLRAALVNLDRWVSEGIEPPASQYPQVAKATAVSPASLKKFFSTIPGVTLPRYLPQLLRLHFGPQWSQGIVDTLPPEVGEPYSSFVSAIDADGNELAGIRLPDLTVPLGTYTGWNQRDPATGGDDDLMPRQGATFPFPRDAAEREAAGDPRLSIEERYSSKSEYLDRFREAALELVAARYILAEDVERMVEGAALRYDLFTTKKGETV